MTHRPARPRARGAPARPRRALGRARRARGRLRRRADDDRRLPHLACGRAASDPGADDDHRRRPLPRARAAARALSRAPRVARPRAARARADPRDRLRAHRAARAGRARRVSARRPREPHGRATSTRSRGSTCAASGRRSSRLVVAVACVVASAFVLPAAAVVLALGLALAGDRRAAARRPRSHDASAGARPPPRGELTAELVELLRGAPELVAYGREDDALARVRAADRELVRLGRRDALVAGLADALAVLVAGLTTVGVLAVAVAAHEAGTLDRVLVAALALLALSSFDAVVTAAGRGARALRDARVRTARTRAHRPRAAR